MSTPTGLARWSQGARYSAYDDRLVITALSGGRTGIIRRAEMSPSAGLRVTVAEGWLAVADAGDRTNVVLAGLVAADVQAAPGDDDGERTDELWAEVVDPEAGLYSLAILPTGRGGGGVLLGWVHVPAGTASAEDLGLWPRDPDFAYGGSTPGPPGPIGPPGPGGPAGAATLIVGYFGDVKTPADLPPDGLIPADWDGPGRPATEVAVELGWALVYQPTGDLWVFTGGAGFAAPWLNVGHIQGPPGEPGPPGPPGAGADLGIGPWVTLTNPGTPGGLGGQSRVRYRVLEFLNAVEFDTLIFIPANLPNAGATWGFGVLPPNARPDFPSGQARIFTAVGNMGIPGVTGGPGSNAGESRIGRWYIAPTGSLEFNTNTASAGNVSWCAIVPRAAAGSDIIAPPMRAATTPRRRKQ